MELDKLRELIGIFESSGLSEIEIEEEGRRIRLTKAAPHVVAPPQLIAHMPSAAPIAVSAPVAQAPSGPAAPPVQDAEPEQDEGIVIIESPMVGVFYASPSPGDPPFVKPGDTVEENQTVCIVEAMKLMNEVAAKFKCTIVNVLVENGEPVEYNQPLFAVKPVE
ncbi:MAG: acetyl-CoA carboxylase biotin carboxyl carrier protein [Candidatus Hydrogenedentes bacterium]|nr:acetyl-CoA carboxylase biotin carboxyl carrier protein [Candidatus Hydrogenedentota bacterium]